jgi:hypothetical protein
VFTIFEQFMLNFGNGSLFLAMGTIPVLNDLLTKRTIPLEWTTRVIFIYFLARSTSLKIDGAVFWLSFAVNVARFGSVNADEFNPKQQTKMLYTEHIIIFPP